MTELEVHQYIHRVAKGMLVDQGAICGFLEDGVGTGERAADAAWVCGGRAARAAPQGMRGLLGLALPVLAALRGALRTRTPGLDGPKLPPERPFRVLEVGGALPEIGVVLAGPQAFRLCPRHSVVESNGRYYAVRNSFVDAGNNTYVEMDRPPRHITPGANLTVAALPFPRKYGYPLFDSTCDGPSCCSPGCFVYWIGDKMCDPNCNVENCHYDFGDCR